jgi:hypothetical protein
MTEIRSAAEGTQAGGRALTGRPGSVSDRGEERIDRVGPEPEGLGADRRARELGRACVKRYPRSGSCDQDRREGIRGRPRAHRARARRGTRGLGRAIRIGRSGLDRGG